MGLWDRFHSNLSRFKGVSGPMVGQGLQFLALLIAFCPQAQSMCDLLNPRKRVLHEGLLPDGIRDYTQMAPDMDRALAEGGEFFAVSESSGAEKIFLRDRHSRLRATFSRQPGYSLLSISSNGRFAVFERLQSPWSFQGPNRGESSLRVVNTSTDQLLLSFDRASAQGIPFQWLGANQLAVNTGDALLVYRLDLHDVSVLRPKNVFEWNRVYSLPLLLTPDLSSLFAWNGQTSLPLHFHFPLGSEFSDRDVPRIEQELDRIERMQREHDSETRHSLGEFFGGGIGADGSLHPHFSLRLPTPIPGRIVSLRLSAAGHVAVAVRVLDDESRVLEVIRIPNFKIVQSWSLPFSHSRILHLSINSNETRVAILNGHSINIFDFHHAQGPIYEIRDIDLVRHPIFDLQLLDDGDSILTQNVYGRTTVFWRRP